MALGTLLGGWRIVRTMGSRITRLHPVQGFCAEAGGAATLFIATAFGVPVSTTHTITGAIVGVGAARKVSAVRWNVATDVVIAWVLTMPAAALIGAAFYKLGEYLRWPPARGTGLACNRYSFRELFRVFMCCGVCGHG
jgi:inorganic phosphate transporter, PiT family